VFQPSQVELDETMHVVLTELDRVHPVRVVLDSMSTLRYMADQPFAYRRHVLSLKHTLVAHGCTTLITDELLVPQELHLRTLAHGVLRLHRETGPFGNERRQMEIIKMRAMPFRSGRHDMVIETGGIRMFPRFTAESGDAPYVGDRLSTGVEPLDTIRRYSTRRTPGYY
jgi:circadian clock protein KaiC